VVPGSLNTSLLPGVNSSLQFSSSRGARLLRRNNTLRSLVVALVLGCGGMAQRTCGQALASTGGEVENGPAPPTMPATAILNQEAAAVQARLNRQNQRQTQPPAPAPALSPSTLAWAAVATLTTVLGFQLLAGRLAGFLNRRSVPRQLAAGSVAYSAAEERSFSEFVTAFKVGPDAPAGVSPPSSRTTSPGHAEPGRGKTGTRNGPLEAFLANVREDLERMRKLVIEVCRLTEASALAKVLGNLEGQLRSLKGKSALPATLPVWQMSCALEALVQQLGKQPEQATPSALRTVVGAVDLLHALCVGGLEPHLVTEPPVRLLAVDDDPICRAALGFALKKAFTEPDLAADGAAGLALAEARAYDVIFLDVEMPGMDGFELCSRIHGTAANQTTPVVFVTVHSDLESRANSILIGAQDLLGKPFLSLELTVKALTLVLHRRLQAHALEAQPRLARPANRSPKKPAESAQRAGRPRSSSPSVGPVVAPPAGLAPQW
jgi:CheY-like chemotaxis protein